MNIEKIFVDNDSSHVLETLISILRLHKKQLFLMIVLQYAMIVFLFVFSLFFTEMNQHDKYTCVCLSYAAF